MTLSIRRGLTTIGAALSIVVLSASAVGAQANKTANGYRISPVRSELTIQKGKSSNITISIENPSDVPTTARAVVNDFVASDDESGTPRLILDDKAPLPKNDFKKLVGSIPDVALAPRERKDVSVKISVPADANAGGYYGAVRFVPAEASQESTVGLTASVGTLVLVTVPGNLTEKLSLDKLSAGQNGKEKSFISSGNVQVITRLKNDGDIHVKPFGRIEVKNMFGKVVSSAEFNNTEPRANVLPGSSRKFTNDVKAKNLLGRYTITANLGYSEGGGDLISTKASFWYVPTWALIVLGVLFAALAVAIYLAVRKFRGGNSHRARK